MSYSSFGEADGGKVASCVPVALVLRGGGDGSWPFGCDRTGTGPASELRSSGAPASRPLGAPKSGAFIVRGVSFPSERGAPGAFGCIAGLKTSLREPGAAGLREPGATGTGARPGAALGAALGAAAPR